MSVLTLLDMTAPLRHRFHIDYHDFGNPDRPPAVVLVAGIHGNELNATFVLSRLAHFLKTLLQAPRGEARLQERVLIIPAVNVLGLNTKNRFWPFDRTDINRMFPGYNLGETTQRIAAAVFELTKKAHYRIDIHASNEDFEELPQVRLYEPTEEEKKTAKFFDLPAIIERRSNQIVTSTMGHSWKGYGGQNFVIQAGMAGQIQPEHCERLFESLVAFLSRIGVLHKVELAPGDQDCHYFGPDQTVPLISEQAGFFISKRKVGQWLKAGDVIGSVFDGFSGEVQAEITAPMPGLLVGLRRQPILYEGDLMASLQSLQKVGRVLEINAGRSQ